MRNRIGSLLMLLGAALILSALLLLNMNRKEDEAAGMAAVEVLPEVIAEIEARNAAFTGAQPEIGLITSNSDTIAAMSGIGSLESTAAANAAMSEMGANALTEPVSTCSPSCYVDPYDTEMTQVTVRGNSYVGYLSIPALGLELPVMADWSYKRLRTAPCRYSGSTKTDDLVILAHNLMKLDSDTFYINHIATVMVDNLRRLLLCVNLSDKTVMYLYFAGVGFLV